MRVEPVRRCGRKIRQRAYIGMPCTYRQFRIIVVLIDWNAYRAAYGVSENTQTSIVYLHVVGENGLSVELLTDLGENENTYSVHIPHVLRHLVKYSRQAECTRRRRVAMLVAEDVAATRDDDVRS